MENYNSNAVSRLFLWITVLSSNDLEYTCSNRNYKSFISTETNGRYFNFLCVSLNFSPQDITWAVFNYIQQICTHYVVFKVRQHALKQQLLLHVLIDLCLRASPKLKAHAMSKFRVFCHTTFRWKALICTCIDDNELDSCSFITALYAANAVFDLTSDDTCRYTQQQRGDECEHKRLGRLNWWWIWDCDCQVFQGGVGLVVCQHGSTLHSCAVANFVGQHCTE